MPSSSSIFEFAQESEFRVCAVACFDRFSSIEQLIVRDIELLKNLGITIHVLTVKDSEFCREIRKISGLHIHERLDPMKGSLDFSIFREVRGIIAAHRIHLVHVFEPPSVNSVAPLCWPRPGGVSIIVSKSVFDRDCDLSLVDRFVLGRLDALCVTNQDTRMRLLEQGSARRWRIRVIRPGIDLQKFSPTQSDRLPIRASWGFGDSEILFGVISKLESGRGQDLAIRAFARLRLIVTPEILSRAKLVFIGDEILEDEGLVRTGLQALIEQLQLGGSVAFAGFHSNIEEVLAALDVLVVPTARDAVSLVALEAMAMNRNSVLVRNHISEEITHFGKFGALVRRDDSYQLASVFRGLIMEIAGEFRRPPSEQTARDWVIENYNPETRLKRMTELYQRAMRRKQAGKAREAGAMTSRDL